MIFSYDELYLKEEITVSKYFNEDGRDLSTLKHGQKDKENIKNAENLALKLSKPNFIDKNNSNMKRES
jgi:hypothetical protein